MREPEEREATPQGPRTRSSPKRVKRTKGTEKRNKQNTELQTENCFGKNQKRTTLLTKKKSQSSKTYRADNREKIREQDRARYARNRERILQREAERRGPPKPKKRPKFKYQAAFNKRVREEKRHYCEVCDTACAKPHELKKHFETKKHVRNSQVPKG